MGGLCPFFDGNGAERSSNLLKTSPIMQTRLRGSAREQPPRRLGWSMQGRQWPCTGSLCDESPAQGTNNCKGFWNPWETKAKQNKRPENPPKPYPENAFGAAPGPSFASPAWACWSTWVPSSLPRHANHLHQGFAAEGRHLFSVSFNTGCAASHLLAELPPCFTGRLLRDAPEKRLEANLTLPGPKGREANRWAGAAPRTAQVCERGYWDRAQSSAPAGPDRPLLPVPREGKGSPQPTAAVPGPAARCEERPSTSGRPFCCSASLQKQELAHLCITLHQFSSKTTKCFYGRKSRPTSPKFLRFK